MTTPSGRDVTALGVAVGEAYGDALVMTAPISLWGGVDASTGVITERAHPQAGRSLSGRVVICPGTHGSNGGAAVMLELVRAGTAPVAWVFHRPSQILLTGVIVARELYGAHIPVVTADPHELVGIEDGTPIVVTVTDDETRVRIL